MAKRFTQRTSTDDTETDSIRISTSAMTFYQLNSNRTGASNQLIDESKLLFGRK